MDSKTQDDSGVGRRMGLARMAKTHSLSSSLNNLQRMEGKPDEKDDISSPHVTHRVHDQSSELHASPLRSLNKQSAAVSLLPNKMNLSELSGQQPIDRKGRGTSLEEDWLSLDSGGHYQIICSDPDFIKNAKPAGRTNHSHPMVNQRGSSDGSEQQDTKAAYKDSQKIKTESSYSISHKLSRQLSRRSHLAPPQVKRSNSMTLLTEAVNQIHNICVFPARQLAKAESEGLAECSSKSPLKSPSIHLPESEGHNMPESPLQACRSASLDELNNIGASYGLPVISPIDAKKKNYLFGGLSSLLGASELDRYFPARTINIFIATWNMNGKEPPVNLEAFLLPEEMDHLPDMFVVGTQESGGSRSEWEVRLQATIGPSHVLFTSAVFGVLHLTIFIRRDLLWFCSVPEEDTYSLRPGIAYKTKGGMAIGFQFFGTRILFINSHLTAHEEKQSLRIQNFRNITHSLDLPRLLPHKHKHKDVTHRYDCVFWLGDLNFRLAVSRDHVFERLKHPGLETYKHLLQWDQLSQAQKKGEAFGEFEEGPINFAPTFKYDPGTDHYDTSSKQRVPSYTDRILFKSNRGAITCVNYSSCPLFRTSDHKPVLGAFHCKIRPGKDDVPLAAGLFNRDVYLEALRRRRRFLYQPTLRNCPVQ
ncbi:inositol polyphosphate 5-phosphatase E isoform X3 [Panulirus ornatus]|uniref:inositol polyphosphate 5-phosphatase E isoform X3 n=1 Tax=Panulirus ornatus TaxID=150431 RepID=UPI003A87C579